MKTLIKLKTTTLLLMPLVLACFALLPGAQAGDAPTPELALPGFNTADGFQALDSLTTGVFNSAFGAKALTTDTSGSHNTAVGGQALLNNNGSYNTAVGENALVFNTLGSMNMALGQGALANNLTGSNNTAMGFQALNGNNADDNTAVGFQALKVNTAGHASLEHENTAIGFQTLISNTTGSGNTAIGSSSAGASLHSNTTGTANVAIGGSAPLNQSGVWNIAIGAASLDTNVSGDRNVAIGVQAGFDITGSRNIDIGTSVFGVTGENNITRIGLATGLSQQTACYVGGIFGRGVSLFTGTGVFVDSNGKLGTSVSSRRFKRDIKPMDNASEALLALKPVTFHYKDDANNTPCFGLIAEDVAKVNPDLVVHDQDGGLLSVRYEQINAMLLNEFLKEHKKMQELEATVAQQQKGMDALVATVKEQAAQIQRVSAQVEMNKPAPTVATNQ
jgi:Chaperone of endosialidase